MFNISGTELVVILVIALVVLGPDKLPDAMRRAGKAYADIRRMTSTFQTEMRNALDEPVREMRETADLLRQSAEFEDRRPPSTPSPASTPTAPATPASSTSLAPEGASTASSASSGTADEGPSPAGDGVVSPAEPEMSAAQQRQDEADDS